MSAYQKFVVAMLVFLQFTVILDFMILSPLGAILMPELKISTSQFGLVVSAYAFSAGISGFLAAGFADRFDRKKLLMFFYLGFLIGTLLCGFAPSYHFLLAARVITGIFGGVIGSIVFAIATDLFPLEMRGRVFGFIQTAFSSSQILGIPLGLYLSNHFGWHAPFFMIATIGALAGGAIWFNLRPINAHLQSRYDKNPFHHLFETLSTPKYLQAFATVVLLSTGGFMIMPFSSAFNVHNLGVELERLPLIYMVTGLCTIVAGPLVGRAADAFGKYNAFVFGSGVSFAMVFIYTHLSITPIAIIILISVMMYIGISSRMIASQSLMSAVPTQKSRGAFMSVSASIQQLSGGTAAIIAGLIVSEGEGGTVEHFDRLGYVVMGAILVSVVMMYLIHRSVHETMA